jgi:hypothetical protein
VHRLSFVVGLNGFLPLLKLRLIEVWPADGLLSVDSSLITSVTYGSDGSDLAEAAYAKRFSLNRKNGRMY